MTLSNEEIIDLIESMEKESKALKKSLFQLCWYMRGSVTIDEMMALSHIDRNIIVDIINSNMEVTKESGLPFF